MRRLSVAHLLPALAVALCACSATLAPSRAGQPSTAAAPPVDIRVEAAPRDLTDALQRNGVEFDEDLGSHVRVAPQQALQVARSFLSAIPQEPHVYIGRLTMSGDPELQHRLVYLVVVGGFDLPANVPGSHDPSLDFHEMVVVVDVTTGEYLSAVSVR